MGTMVWALFHFGDLVLFNYMLSAKLSFSPPLRAA